MTKYMIFGWSDHLNNNQDLPLDEFLGTTSELFEENEPSWDNGETVFGHVLFKRQFNFAPNILGGKPREGLVLLSTDPTTPYGKGHPILVYVEI